MASIPRYATMQTMTKQQVRDELKVALSARYNVHAEYQAYSVGNGGGRYNFDKAFEIAARTHAKTGYCIIYHNTECGRSGVVEKGRDNCWVY